MEIQSLTLRSPNGDPLRKAPGSSPEGSCCLGNRSCNYCDHTSGAKMAKIYFSSEMPRGTTDDCERGREPTRSNEPARAGVRKAATEKGERKKKKRGGGGRRRQNSRVVSKAQPKTRTAAKQRFPSLPASPAGTGRGAGSTKQKTPSNECCTGGPSTWNEVCKRIHVAVKGAQAASGSG